jgi:hypothetical protein
MIQQYTKYSEQQLKALLKNTNAEIRFAAAYAVGENKAPLPRELIGLLNDSHVSVQQASRRSLILLACHATGPRKSCEQLTRQVRSLLKFGPEPTTKEKLVTRAVDKWNGWWDDNDPQLLKLVSASRSPGENEAASSASEKNSKTGSRSNVAADAASAEEVALAKLKLARMLASEGLETKAQARYQEIVDQYPNTKAAREARKLLGKKKQ